MVLSTHFEEYEKGEAVHDTLHSLFGTGVFNSDGLSLACFHRASLTLLRCVGERWKCVDKIKQFTLRLLTSDPGSTGP